MLTGVLIIVIIGRVIVQQISAAVVAATGVTIGNVQKYIAIMQNFPT